MVLMIDNYDSFTYNLVQYLSQIGADVQVTRNDAVTLREIETMAPTAIVISPGPGRPADAGLSLEIVRHFLPTIPILGVCLGHQTLAEACGGVLFPPGALSTAKRERSNTRAMSYFKGCGVRSPGDGTIPWWWNAARSPTPWRLSPKQATITKLWRSNTGSTPPSASSSTPNRC